MRVLAKSPRASCDVRRLWYSLVFLVDVPGFAIGSGESTRSDGGAGASFMSYRMQRCRVYRLFCARGTEPDTLRWREGEVSMLMLVSLGRLPKFAPCLSKVRWMWPTDAIMNPLMTRRATAGTHRGF